MIVSARSNSLNTVEQQPIQVNFPSGKALEMPYGTRVIDLLDDEEFLPIKDRVVGGMVNNESVSLTFKVEVNAAFRPITMDSDEGARIYRRSLCFLLTIASERLFPHRRLVIGHSLGDGYFYHFDGEEEVSSKDIEALKSAMKLLVKEDHLIIRKSLSYSDTLEYLKKAHRKSAVKLFLDRSDAKIPVYECCEFRDISHGALVQCTGVLGWFDIVSYRPGFLLRYPSVTEPETIQPFKEHPVVFAIFQEYKRWGKIYGVSNAGELNSLVRNSEISSFIQVAEALHDRKIAKIADKIDERREEIKIVLIAGPSSSGKTTFAKKLSVQLRVLGFSPLSISTDDYFLPRDLSPRDEHGNFDFETVDAIDIDLLNQHLAALLGGSEVELPKFNFKTGTTNPSGRTIKIDQRTILVMEGIHSLNDRLTHRIDRASKFHIYVSALTQLNIDDHNRIPTTDVRLIRRMVRDYQFRGYTALETIGRWPSVRSGEMKNIFPYEKNAEVAFNSSLDYELPVLKVYADSLLRTIKPFHEVYGEAVRISRFLANFIAIPANFVPFYSLLREFIGDSGFRY